MRLVKSLNGTCRCCQPAVLSTKNACHSSACSPSLPPSLISNSVRWLEPVPLTQKLNPPYPLQSWAVGRFSLNPPYPATWYGTPRPWLPAAAPGRSVAATWDSTGVLAVSLPNGKIPGLVVVIGRVPSKSSTTGSVPPPKAAEAGST